jgi:hypothetical protein
MTTTIVPHFTNIDMHGSSFKKQIFIEFVKATKSTMMKICSFSLRDPNTTLRTIKLIDDLSKNSNARFHDRWWAKIYTTSKITLFPLGCDLSPNFLLK